MEENISKKMVWVVDDDIPSYQLIEELFAGLNVSLKHFVDGHDLMSWIKGSTIPDLIIMDIQLPGIDGLELTRQIKAIEPSIPVIACTSYAMPGDKERCLKSGCDEYVSKPIDLDGFLTRVKKFIGD